MNKKKAELLGQGCETDPYPVWARLRQEEPVSKVVLRDGLHCWLVTRYDDARAALADPLLSRDPRVAGPWWQESDRGRKLEDGAHLGVHLLTREAPDHTRLRRLVSAAFTQRRAKAMRERVQEIADSLIDAVQARGHADLVADFAYPLATTVICEVMGIPTRDRDLFRQWTSNAVVSEPEGNGAHAVPPRSPDDYLRALVAAKRRAPGDDLVSALVTAGEDRLSETELLSMLFLLLIAGHEGMVGLIANATLALLENPDQLLLLRDRPDLWSSAVEEVLRYDGPMELAAWRFTAGPVTIGGTPIPAGEPVVISLAAAHRDPDRFDEPDRLDVTRSDNPHLGFGHGLHYCLGAPLARLEGGIAMETLFRRLPDLSLAVSAERLHRQPSFVLRGLYDLPVTFTPVRSPARSR
ncbi:cytochrome P450 family protein [Streptosporangium carneum]|uniref:Cytochrome P450 hydroxylase n=1 Tax=Streptosporangium carneum TaxID=47481 RepID=A0A9W6I9N6_9ACTN|nr:cytochrome P450 [Streptosporangium carneum]GLK14627.1 cytochrome P450 hydroxylase [Streptosporangium carneum]